MPTKSLKQILKELSFEKKLLGFGSLLLIVSLFLPWYQDLDSFKTGDMFLGITGPAYLIGFSLLALAVLNLVLMGMDFLGKKISFLPVKNSKIYIFTGLFVFYALIVINSLYFHHKFGVNITLKQSQFGMFLAFIAASFITVGGYLALRDKGAILKEFQENAQESFIQVPEQESRKPKENLRKMSDEQKQEKKEPAPQIQMPDIITASTPEPVKEVVTDTPEKDDKQTPPQPFRMDL